ncbi:MAG TPA: hypothetical protein GX006_05175 [Clostridiales bacterium]|jgi:hypothetical protein|nr:hypothetical protein [Clostridiales bacterium]
MTSGSAIYIVVDRGKANKLLNRARQVGAKRGTIFLGEGTMPSPILDFFGINQTQKEVLLIAVPGSAHEDVYRMLKQEFQLHKRYKGIAFSVPYVQYTPEEGVHQEAKNRAENAPFVCLMTVLEKGLGSECMKVAREAGARGGTIVSAHGAGVPQDFYFPLVIEPQKDLVMIVTPRASARRIRHAIYEGMRLERKGAGIIFALPVTRTLGLYEERAHKKAVDK